MKHHVFRLSIAVLLLGLLIAVLLLIRSNAASEKKIEGLQKKLARFEQLSDGQENAAGARTDPEGRTIFPPDRTSNVSGLGVGNRAVRRNPNKDKTIAVIPKGTASPWWEVVHEGAEDAAREEGFEIFWTGPKLENDREKQIQVVEDAVSQRVAAIVLGPNDAFALVRPVEKAGKAGIPIVVIDSKPNTDAFDSFAATDNYAGGAEAARRLGKALNGKGKIIITHFLWNMTSTDERAKGFKETIVKEFPGIAIVAEQYTQGTVEDAIQKTTDLLIRNKDADGVFAVNQPTSVGAYKAIQSRNLTKRVKFVGFDSDPLLLEGIEKGEVEALIVQDPYQIGYTGVKTAISVLKGEKVEKLIPIPGMIVDRNNIEEQKRKNPAALGLQYQATSELSAVMKWKRERKPHALPNQPRKASSTANSKLSMPTERIIPSNVLFAHFPVRYVIRTR